MATTPYTAAQVQALRNAIAAGVTSVSFGDKRTEFRSLAEMRQILAEAELSLSGASRIRQVRMTSSGDKGL